VVQALVGGAVSKGIGGDFGAGALLAAIGRVMNAESSLAVDDVFEHFSYRTAEVDSIAPSEFPGQTRSALRKILKSPVGRKIGLTAIGRDTKIRLALRSIPGSEPKYFRHPEGDSNLITYSLDVDGFKRGLGSIAAEIGGLDTILMHEIGHTAVAAAAMGMPLHSWSFSLTGEYDAVRRFENPYRQWAGYPLRSSYGGSQIPDPLIIKP